MPNYTVTEYVSTDTPEELSLYRGGGNLPDEITIEAGAAPYPDRDVTYRKAGETDVEASQQAEAVAEVAGLGE